MKRLYVFILAALFLSSCGKTQSAAESRRLVYAMDTAVTLTACGDNAEAALEAAEAEINRLDRLLSRGNEKSEIYSLNSRGTVGGETASLIETAKTISEKTDGAFDITIAPVMDLWGFFGHNCRVPTDGEIKAEIAYVGYENIETKNGSVRLKNGAAVDLGGIAKGYASDCAAKIFRDSTITSGLISFGSALWAMGKKPDGSAWKIGIANPIDTSENIATLELTDKCIATSGSYEQAFEENGRTYHHIIDPKTGYPVESGLASVSIIAENGAYADGLSTAVFVMGLEEAIDFWRAERNFEMVLITDEGALYATKGIVSSISSKMEINVINA